MSRTWLNTLAAGTMLMTTGAVRAADAPSSAPAPRAMFARQPGLRPNILRLLATPNWTFSYTYQGTSYKDVFIGNDPSAGGSITVPIYIIPIKMVFGTTKEDALKTLSNGKTVIQNTLDSPVFQSNVDFKQGTTNIGTTQFTDAFQKASIWGKGGNATGYHVLLGKPTVEPEQTLKVPSNKGSVGSPFGTKVIEADINWFDAKIQPMIAKFKIPANALPIFVTTDTYLTQGGCCIGGYHSYTGTTAYSHFTYIDVSGEFAQDVSALSHELAEWMDDPTVNNNSACGIYEVGDPLEGDANYGDFPYTAGGFTYHLQDEATPVYFGAPASTSLNGKSTFRGATLNVCANGS